MTGFPETEMNSRSFKVNDNDNNCDFLLAYRSNYICHYLVPRFSDILVQKRKMFPTLRVFVDCLTALKFYLARCFV